MILSSIIQISFKDNTIKDTLKKLLILIDVLKQKFARKLFLVKFLLNVYKRSKTIIIKKVSFCVILLNLVILLMDTEFS